MARTLAALELRPTKGRGQNFLIDPVVVEKVIDALQPGPNDHVVEVGPGLGILTAELLARAATVTAIEIDERLASHLRTKFPVGTFRLVVGDALTLSPVSFVDESGDYLFAANLPYSVGSAIVRRFLELETPPRRMVVMVQREVAERMTASPPDMSVLGVSVQLYSRASIAFDVSSAAFKPRPKVTSSVVVLNRRTDGLLSADERAAFFEVVHAGFHQKRKQLVNTLSSGLGLPKSEAADWLERSGIAPDQRAETLDVEDWLTLYRSRPSK